jgi:hypothetical protein
MPKAARIIKGNVIGFFLPVANVLGSRKTVTTPEAKVSKVELRFGASSRSLFMRDIHKSLADRLTVK